ncbi:MAG: metallophosphoesterase [Bacteroidia bacterium]
MVTATRIISFLSIILAILVLIDVYSFTGLKASFRNSSKKTRKFVFGLYWLINGGFILSLLVTALFFAPKHGLAGAWIKFLMGTFFILYVPKLFYIIFLLPEDVYRLIRAMGVGIYKLASKNKTSSPELFQSRRKFIANTGALVASVPFAGMLYGVEKGKYNFKIHKAEISFKDLPKQFNGLRITQLSDIHSGSFGDREAVSHAVDMANAQGSDIMFFTGDLVNNISDEMDPWMDVFSRLKAPMGVYSILGNHDYGDYSTWPSAEAKQANMEKLYSIHKQLGFRLMRNENLKIERSGAHIELLGLENWGRGGFSKYGDLKKTLEGTEPGSFKILLSHDPSIGRSRL